MDSKLSARNQTRFKKSSFSSTISAAKKNTNLCMREQTIFNKAYELSTLCDIEVCVLFYGPDGELIKTWPEDQSKVRDMAQRFSKLSDKEKRKKSTNLSQFLNKKINDEKKRSLDKNDNKFSQKLLEMEHSLETRLQILQDKLRLLHPPDQTEMRAVSTDLSPSLIVDRHQQWTEPLMDYLSTESRATDLSTTTSSSLNHPSNCSVFLYNHDNATFTQLASTFDQHNNGYGYSDLLLGAQGFGGSNNIPQMQTQNPFLHFDQFTPWDLIQTPSFRDPVLFM